MDYKSKAKDSFKTKWNLYCFELIKLGKKDFSWDSFKRFEISSELIRFYVAKYHQYELTDRIEEIGGLNPNEIYKKLEGFEVLPERKFLEQRYVESFDSVFPLNEFEQLENVDKCFYCGTTNKDFDKLYEKDLIFKKANRGFNFELDRKEANFEYTEDNCVMACYWCNNAKTDEFNAEEFKPIGMSIGQAFQKRLKSIKR